MAKSQKEESYPKDILCLLGATQKHREKWTNNYSNAFDKCRDFTNIIYGDDTKDRERRRALRELSLQMHDAILMGVKIKTLRDTEEILWYNSEQGIWKNGGEVLIKEILRIIDYNISMRMCSEVIDKIKTSTYEFRNNFDTNPHLALRNGVLDLLTGELQEHNPKHLLTKRLDVSYDPNAIPKNILKFLSEIQPKEKVELLFEILAWCLTPEYKVHKIFVFTGKGSNGKTTLLMLYTRFLGKENVSSIPLQAFDTNQYAPSHLYGKFANICADISDKELNRTGMIKMLSGGDRVSVNVKYRDMMSFTNNAKFIFSANVLPAIRYDDTDAIWRRVQKVDFKIQIPPKKQDPDLIHKLTADEELSGLLNIIIPCYQEFVKRGGFSQESSIRETREEYILRSNSIHAFAEWGLKYKKNNKITNSKLWEGYLSFCRFHNIIPKSQQSLTKNLQVYKTKIFRGHSGKERIWNHVELKQDFSLPKPDDENGTSLTEFSLLLVSKYHRYFTYYNKENAVIPVKDTMKVSSHRGISNKAIDLIINELEESSDIPVPIEQIYEKGEKQKIKRFIMTKAINYLENKGRIFNPKNGYLKKGD